MSARARFLVFLLWEVKIEGLVLEGRVRAALVAAFLDGVWARREDSWEVKAMVEELEISLEGLDLGRGIPYREAFEAMMMLNGPEADGKARGLVMELDRAEPNCCIT